MIESRISLNIDEVPCQVCGKLAVEMLIKDFTDTSSFIFYQKTNCDFCKNNTNLIDEVNPKWTE